MYNLIVLTVLSLNLLSCECNPINETTHAADKLKSTTSALNKPHVLNARDDFDLAKIGSLNDTEFDQHYFSIIKTMRKQGPDCLQYINRTDLIEVGFGAEMHESPVEARKRWESCCDHFLQDGTQTFFKNFVLQRIYRPPPFVNPNAPKKPPTNKKTLMSSEDAVLVKKKK